MKPQFLSNQEKKLLDSKLGKIYITKKYLGALWIEYETGNIYILRLKGWEKMVNNLVNLKTWEKLVEKDLLSLTDRKRKARVKT